MKTYTVPVVDVETFKQMVLDSMEHGMKNYSIREVCATFIYAGVVKFDKENIAEFLKSFGGMMYLPPVAVDFGDSMFLWMVCGTDAILVKKIEILVDKRAKTCNVMPT